MLVDVRPELYTLSQVRTCPLCEEERNVQGVDHIIPVAVARWHKPLSLIKGDNANKIRLCRPHHNLVDFDDRGRKGKITVFLNGGIEGIVDYIAGYPRVRPDDLKPVQHRQWIELFELIRDGLTVVDEQYLRKYPLLVKYYDNYKRAIERIDKFLMVWRDQGDFVRSLQ